MNVKDFTRPRVPMAALCLFALCALTVPASALAAGHRGTNAHGAKLVVKKKSKKKPKKKPPTPVIVKCASVTVTCKGTPGATGPQGPTGLNGANGSPSCCVRAAPGLSKPGRRNFRLVVSPTAASKAKTSPSVPARGRRVPPRTIRCWLTYALGAQ